MLEISTIGLDIAKNVFHAHGADAPQLLAGGCVESEGRLIGAIAVENIVDDERGRLEVALRVHIEAPDLGKLSDIAAIDLIQARKALTAFTAIEFPIGRAWRLVDTGAKQEIGRRNQWNEGLTPQNSVRHSRPWFRLASDKNCRARLLQDRKWLHR